MVIVRDILYLILVWFTWPVWLIYLLKTGKIKTDWAGRFGRSSFVKESGDNRPVVMIHAVSVGEVNACRKLIELLRTRHGDHIHIILSVTTNTGTARAHQVLAGQVEIVRYPFDFSPFIKRFIKAVQPDVVVLVELELWPNFSTLMKQNHIPLMIINGRLSERSFKRYYQFRNLLGSMFRRLDLICAQDEDYAGRFKAMVDDQVRVIITGNMKWDAQVISDDCDGSEELAKNLGIDRSRPLIVCGSTGPGEELMIQNAIQDLALTIPDGPKGQVQLLYAPRKPERFNEVADSLNSDKREVRRLSVCRENGDKPVATYQGAAGTIVYLLDTIGDLRKAYALADVAIVGRSFCDLYGSDMTEPISLGKPTIIGPNTKDFKQMVDMFLVGEGLVKLNGINELRGAISTMVHQGRGSKLGTNGRAVIKKQQGASLRHVDEIEKMLKISPSHTD